MFQKLYRHLEEMNDNLRRQGLAAGTSSTYEKEILEQLSSLNETVKSAKLDLRRGVKKPSSVLPIITVSMVGVAVGAVVFMNLQLSELSHRLIDRGEKDNHKIELQSEATRDRQELHRQQKIEAAQLTTLDSIIIQESQALLELKALNKISVRTFIRLNNRIDQTNHLIQMREIDTGHYVGQSR